MAVLVFGDAMLDTYIDGTVTRISPEAPVPIVHVQHTYYKAGGCANVAIGIAAHQVPTSLIATLGNDAQGRQLTQLSTIALLTPHYITTALPTINKVRVVSNKHQLLRYDYETVAEPNISALKKIKKAVQQASASLVVISDYAKGNCTQTLCQHIIQATSVIKGKVLVDPKSADWSKYSGAYLISPNFKELCQAVGHTIPHTDADITTSARQLLQQYNISHLLVTRSQQGLSLISATQAYHIPTAATDVADVTGAGDTVLATLAAMLYKGKSLLQAVRIANQAAGIAVAHFGTYTVTSKHLLFA